MIEISERVCITEYIEKIRHVILKKQNVNFNYVIEKFEVNSRHIILINIIFETTLLHYFLAAALESCICDNNLFRFITMLFSLVACDKVAFISPLIRSTFYSRCDEDLRAGGPLYTIYSNSYFQMKKWKKPMFSLSKRESWMNARKKMYAERKHKEISHVLVYPCTQVMISSRVTSSC